ncbi:MAG: ribosome biogenesis GTPase YlqF [Clostridiales bacterium]|nr:ribosome biogenesis GTPase YlqF [Clostridiales bacterium]
MNEFQKQTVQWFPGHMAKTRRLIQEHLKQVDAVAELADARVPQSSRNPELDEITAGKPRILLLNKCDMADAAATRDWVAHYKEQGLTALAVDCRSGRGLNAFAPALKALLADRIQANIDRGMAGRPLRIMVVGIPNTGKSSFINRMAGRSRAKVADLPGVTRQNQWFAIGNGLELLDTPGVLWPKFDDAQVGDRLAFTGAVKDAVVDTETLAMRLLDVLQVQCPASIGARYKLKDYEGKDGYAVLEAIGRRRGFLIAGGAIDTERAAVMVLDEFRGGLLGRITLERPEDTL